ncbi:MAG: SRPBCC family protein, partial [Nocardiopsaceae bacterium]|nr:SRPBCC family protein [Nocardiopsaceae bacterium]
MFTVAVSVFAPVALDTAIAYVADFRNAPMWQHGLSTVEVSESFPAAKSVIEIRQFLGRRIEAPGDLVDWDPGKGFTVRGHSGPLQVESRYSFTSENGGTRVGLHLTMAATGVARVAEPVLRRNLTRELNAAFERLGRLLQNQYGENTWPSAEG